MADSIRKSRKTKSPPTEPVVLTQEEVEAKAVGGRKAAAVTRKIHYAVPTKSAGRLRSEAATPIPISSKEMATIRARRKPSAAVTRRIKGSTVGEKIETKRPRTKQMPKKKARFTKRS